MLNIELIPLSKIQVQNRQRTLYDPQRIKDLAQSIHRNGLIHIPIVRGSDDTPIIVTGGRRFQAITLLANEGLSVSFGGQECPVGFMPCFRFEDLTQAEYEELELEENIQRVDLTWQERVAATKRVFDIKKQLDPSFNAPATASLLSEKTGIPTTVQTVTDRLLLAEHMDKPEVARAPDEKEAMKALYRVLEGDFANALLATVRSAPTNGSSNYTLLEGPMQGHLINLPEGSIDLILTDPPYGVGADSFDAGSQATWQHGYKDDEKTAVLLANITFQVGFRLTKPQAHLYMFCDIRAWKDLAELAANAGWYTWAVPLIWYKQQGHIPRPNHGPQRTYEAILYAIKGNKPIRQLYRDVLIHPLEQNRAHPAQKPVSLYHDLLTTSTVPGNTVLDPFAGSGTIFEAAAKANCKAIGIEQDPTSIVLCRERIAKL